MELDVDLPKVDMLGDHYILVTCKDKAGNEVSEGMDFKLMDTKGPVVESEDYPGDTDIGNDVKVEIAFSDAGGLAKVDAGLWTYKYLGDDFGIPVYSEDLELITSESQEYPMPIFDLETFSHVFDTYYGTIGDYEVRYTVTDINGNETKGVLKGKLL